MTIDVAPTAVRQARDASPACLAVTAIVGAIPAAIPPAPYDLVVASEILYYLSADELAGTLAMLERELSPVAIGGRRALAPAGARAAA